MTDPQGLSRRKFLQGVGAGAVAAGALPVAAASVSEASTAAPQDPSLLDGSPASITLNVNGEDRALTVEPRVTLLDALRNRLDITGAKKVCDRATCGACTVLVDGKAIYGCTMLAVQCQGRKIETVESLANGDQLSNIQSCFVKNDAQQCGFCTPGFVVACESHLRRNPKSTRRDVEAGLGGNLCRCGTYVGIKQAVVDAAMKGGR